MPYLLYQYVSENPCTSRIDEGNAQIYSRHSTSSCCCFVVVNGQVNKLYNLSQLKYFLTSLLTEVSGVKTSHIVSRDRHVFAYVIILSSADLLKLTIAKISFRYMYTSRMSNSLDPYHDHRFVGHGLGPNCLQMISARRQKTSSSSKRVNL